MNHKKLSILIVAEEVNYDRTSGGLVNAKIIHSLSRYHHCHVLTEGHIPADFPNFHAGKLFHFYFNKPVWLKLIAKLPVARSAVSWIKGINHNSFHKYIAWKDQIASVVKEHEYDVILLLGTGMGYYAHQAWADLGYKHISAVMAIHDPYPMALLPPPYQAKWDRGEKLLAKRFSKLIGQCRYCWSSSLRQLEWMYDMYPVLQQKGIVIPHLAMQPPFDLALRKGNQDEVITQLSTLHTRNEFVLLHMGSLLKGRDPHYLFDAFTQWLNDHPEAAKYSKLVFVGKVHAALMPAFEKVAKHPNFLCITDKRVSYQQALALQQSATANLILESLEKVSPQLFGKFSDAVLSDRPIFCIGPEASEARRLLGEAYPYQATNGDVATIYQCIELLYKQWLQDHDLRLQRPDLQYACNPDRILDAMQKMAE
jgi:hypothetical protein